jgi:7-cyano-7-deazaguanosine (preQ0) biosynthesis protein QueE
VTSLVVSEVFGPTFQGEGPHTGQRVAFIRLGGCNLHCSWCDTPYTWDASRFDLRAELAREPVEAIVRKVLDTGPHRVVISGGEPLLHQNQPGWVELLRSLDRYGLPVEVETNGTQVPTPFTVDHVDTFNVSPKLEHAGDPESLRIVGTALRAFAELAVQGHAVLKIVAQCAAQVAQARHLAETYWWPLDTVWVMPEGTDAETLLARQRELAEAALTEGVNMTTRLHVLVWGQERAR